MPPRNAHASHFKTPLGHDGAWRAVGSDFTGHIVEVAGSMVKEAVVTFAQVVKAGLSVVGHTKSVAWTFAIAQSKVFASSH